MKKLRKIAMHCFIKYNTPLIKNNIFHPWQSKSRIRQLDLKPNIKYATIIVCLNHMIS